MRGSTGTPRAWSRALTRYSTCASERVADPGEPDRPARAVSSRERNSWRSPRCIAVTRASSRTASPSRGMAAAQRRPERPPVDRRGGRRGGRLRLHQHGTVAQPDRRSTLPARGDPARAARVRAPGRAGRRCRHRGLRLRLVLLPRGAAIADALRSSSTASRSPWPPAGCRGSTRSARCIRRSTRSPPATSTAIRTPGGSRAAQLPQRLLGRGPVRRARPASSRTRVLSLRARLANGRAASSAELGRLSVRAPVAATAAVMAGARRRRA